jgi:hypothetical protein
MSDERYKLTNEREKLAWQLFVSLMTSHTLHAGMKEKAKYAFIAVDYFAEQMELHKPR